MAAGVTVGAGFTGAAATGLGALDGVTSAAPPLTARRDGAFFALGAAFGSFVFATLVEVEEEGRVVRAV